ncbi:MAG: RIP metalloprotease RseP [Rikenellaceae bacterium]
MEILIKAAQLILSLSLLVVIHEAGHFMFAKLFGTRVEKFYLFFNPWFSLFKFKKGETEYGIGWIPFGGYVKISGMIDESMDKEQMKLPPEPYEFRSKTAWQRLLIMVGGVMMNVILAIIIYIGISHTYGTSYISNNDVKSGYMFSPIAKEMGFKDGDKILNVDGKTFDNYREITISVIFDDVEYVEIERNGEVKKVYIDKALFPRLLEKGSWFLELRTPIIVDSLLPGAPADVAGFKKGDKVIAIDSTELQFFDQFKTALASKAGETAIISVQRDSSGTKIEKQLSVSVSTDTTIGFFQSQDISEIYPIKTIKYSFLESIPQGFKLAANQIDNYTKQIKLIFSPETEAYKAVGSVVSMGNMFGATWDWLRFWNITAFLSIILAVMNILPIPALDGGHVLFLIYEVVTRRKPSEKFMEYAQTFGMFLLMALMVLALGNDIYKLFQ